MTDDRTRRSILARRARFVAAALTTAGLGVGAALSSTGCSDDAATTPDPVGDAGGADTGDTGPSVCLAPVQQDTGTDTGASSDASADTSADAATDTSTPDTTEDTGPTPCLKMPFDGGDEDTGPVPCLAPPLDGG